MDRGAWRATVRGSQRVRHNCRDLAGTHTHPLTLFRKQRCKNKAQGHINQPVPIDQNSSFSSNDEHNQRSIPSLSPAFSSFSELDPERLPSMRNLSNYQISQVNPVFSWFRTLKHFIWYLMVKLTKFFLIWAKQLLAENRQNASLPAVEPTGWNLWKTFWLVRTGKQKSEINSMLHVSSTSESHQRGVLPPSPNPGRQGLLQDTMLQ